MLFWALAFRCFDMPQPSPVPSNGLLSDADVRALLDVDTVAQRVLAKGEAPRPGDLVGVRLNLNVLKTTGQALQTLHKPTNRSGYRRNQGFYNGEACGYAQAVVLREAYFNVSQGGREAIATGQHHKFPMASIDGTLVSTQAPEGFEGVEVSFNPRTQHLFVDSTHQAVRSAEEVVILGHRAYARGRIEYHTEATAPARAGDFPSLSQLQPAADLATHPPARRRRAGP